MEIIAAREPDQQFGELGPPLVWLRPLQKDFSVGICPLRKISSRKKRTADTQSAVPFSLFFNTLSDRLVMMTLPYKQR
jgi:hypothetical protein